MKKVLSLLVVLGMLFVAGNAFAWNWDPNVTAQGSAMATTDYSVGGQLNNAGGWSYGAGSYDATGLFVAYGTSDADSTTKAFVNGGFNWRSAAACTHSSSDAFGFTFGLVTTTVAGGGEVAHNTNLGTLNGGSTGGYAAYSYGSTNHGCLIGYNSGSGAAMTAGHVSRSHILGGMTAHAASTSFAYSTGGGSLTQ